MPKKALDFHVVREIALTLANVEKSTLHGAVSLKVRGKLLACPAIHRSAEPNSLMVRIGPAERAQLLSAAPDTYYLTDHYLNHSAVLVRLSKIDRKSLESLLKKSVAFCECKKSDRQHWRQHAVGTQHRRAAKRKFCPTNQFLRAFEDSLHVNGNV